jgi:hypothetical protein
VKLLSNLLRQAHCGHEQLRSQQRTAFTVAYRRFGKRLQGLLRLREVVGHKLIGFAGVVTTTRRREIMSARTSRARVGLASCSSHTRNNSSHRRAHRVFSGPAAVSAIRGV